MYLPYMMFYRSNEYVYKMSQPPVPETENICISIHKHYYYY